MYFAHFCNLLVEHQRKIGFDFGMFHMDIIHTNTL